MGAAFRELGRPRQEGVKGGETGPGGKRAMPWCGQGQDLVTRPIVVDSKEADF